LSEYLYKIEKEFSDIGLSYKKSNKDKFLSIYAEKQEIRFQ